MCASNAVLVPHIQTATERLLVRAFGNRRWLQTKYRSLTRKVTVAFSCQQNKVLRTSVRFDKDSKMRHCKS